jgi:hypothetical protein
MTKTEQAKNEYLALARKTALSMGSRGKAVTINDVRARVGNPPPRVNPNIMGAVFKGKKWIKVGWVNSGREAAKQRAIGRFKRVA